jgi:protein phosphatase
MVMNTPIPAAAGAAAGRKPRDEELDVFGLTHMGRIRQTNQDHFLVCSLRRQVQVHHTSLPDTHHWPTTERLALLAMVADGVGSSALGGEASRLAVECITEYVAQSMNAYYAANSMDDEGFSRALQEAAMRVHARVVKQAKADPAGRGMATTLTLYLGVWPRAYLLQLGDSRCYLMRNDTLRQVTRDQTMAQELVDQGVLTRAEAPAPAGPTCSPAPSAGSRPRPSSPGSRASGIRWSCSAATGSPSTCPTSGSPSGSGR